MPSLVWRLLADLTVIVHVTYVAFVLVGQLLILWGILRGWSWIRNRTFRFLHLAAILIVVAESWAGLTCPLTTWEQQLRQLAGQTSYRGDFIARWMHDLLFFDAPRAVFTICYTLFGLLVLSSMWLAPPRRKREPAGP